MVNHLLKAVEAGDFRAIARAISFIENSVPGSDYLLETLQPGNTPLIGITGPPGAGKSSITDALIKEIISAGKKVAVLCVDPSSPFNMGSLLGDRIRMNQWYNHTDVYIRSLASRGSLGGLHPFIIEITQLIRAAPFDYIIVETVGVGQSEIEIAGLADVTVVVMVPEAGDEVQTMKAGIMEIADIFVVNKADRDGADLFVKNLHAVLGKTAGLPVLKTNGLSGIGIAELFTAINLQLSNKQINDKKIFLTAYKVWLLVQKNRMSDLAQNNIAAALVPEMEKSTFNLFKFARQFYTNH